MIKKEMMAVIEELLNQRFTLKEIEKGFKRVLKLFKETEK